jgi:ABC-2 type transport system permease protein
VVGAGLYLAVVAVLALALGVLLRSSVATISVVVALMLVVPGMGTALPGSWQSAAVPYLPAEAGQAVIGHTRFAPAGAQLLAPWTGFAVLCAYAAAALVAAAVTLSRRDSG